VNDLIEAINSIRRAVGTGELAAGEAHVVTASRTYTAPVDDVWDALTNPERIPRWFLPVEGDLRLGGTYQFAGNAGGEIRECDPPRRLLVTWVMGEPGPEDSSIVEVVLEPVGEDETALTLEHTAVVPAEMWEQFGPGSVGVGWDLGLLGLGAHLAGLEVGGPEDLETDRRCTPPCEPAATPGVRLWPPPASTPRALPHVSPPPRRSTSHSLLSPTEQMPPPRRLEMRSRS
jgi:uncharacterized protein YndB with AHSA1/START domain